MTGEVKRNNWSRFFKRFNQQNRFRTAAVSVRTTDGSTVRIADNTPLLGVTIAKKGRLIDGFQLFTARHEPERTCEPLVRLNQPTGLCHQKDESGRITCLTMSSADGAEVTLEFTGEYPTDSDHELVEILAYTIFEHRGRNHGRDLDDWIQAEQAVRFAKEELAD